MKGINKMKKFIVRLFFKIKGKIKFYGTLNNHYLRITMKISTVTLSEKLNNKVYFNQIEIYNACKNLQISKEEIPIYFFTPNLS